TCSNCWLDRFFVDWPGAVHTTRILFKFALAQSRRVSPGNVDHCHTRRRRDLQRRASKGLRVMPSFYLPFAITVGGMLLYHLSQKSIPKEMNPFHATAIAYVMGIVVCAVLGFTYSDDRSIVNSLKT